MLRCLPRKEHFPDLSCVFIGVLVVDVVGSAMNDCWDGLINWTLILDRKESNGSIVHQAHALFRYKIIQLHFHFILLHREPYT